jgi:hypothetical protein
MSRDFALLLEHLRTKTGEVEIDLPAPQREPLGHAVVGDHGPL